MTTKAFMSDHRARRGRWGWDPGRPSSHWENSADDAECEARMILGCVEPPLLGTDHTRIGDFDPSCLAEALAAFVEE